MAVVKNDVDNKHCRPSLTSVCPQGVATLVCCKVPSGHLPVSAGGGKGPSEHLAEVVFSLTSGEPVSSAFLGVLKQKNQSYGKDLTVNAVVHT